MKNTSILTTLAAISTIVLVLFCLFLIIPINFSDLENKLTEKMLTTSGKERADIISEYEEGLKNAKPWDGK